MKTCPWIRLSVLTLTLTSIPVTGEGLAVEPAPTGTIVQIVRAGQPTPDASTAFTPALEILGFNNEGQVAFLSSHTGTTGAALNSRIYVGSPENLTEIVRVGRPAPDRDGTFSAFSSYVLYPLDITCPIEYFSSMSPPWETLAAKTHGTFYGFNSQGRLTFLAGLIGTIGGTNMNVGVFLGSPGSVAQIARSGQPVPDGGGVFSTFSIPVVNDNGVVAFQSSILSSSGRQNCLTGIFFGRGTALTQIAKSGQSAPNGAGIFSGFSTPVINNKEQVAFVGYLSGSTQGLLNSALYRVDDATLIELARVGQPAPDGNGRFLSFGMPALNDQGQVAFQALLTETKGGQRDTHGVFLATDGGLRQLARSGQPASDGNGTIFDFSFPLLNNAGQVVVVATFTGTRGGGSDDTAIFLYTEDKELKQIARAGSRAPDGNGRIAAVGRPWINRQGQVAFQATFIESREGANDNSGIFLDDGDTLVEIVRAGQPAPDGNGKFSGVGYFFMNDAGQIAFYGTLRGTSRDEYDYTGIYIWSPGRKK
jgi:hypothetical protein